MSPPYSGLEISLGKICRRLHPIQIPVPSRHSVPFCSQRIAMITMNGASQSRGKDIYAPVPKIRIYSYASSLWMHLKYVID